MVTPSKTLKQHLKATDAQIDAFTARIQLFMNTNIKRTIKELKSGKESEFARGLDKAQVLGSLFKELEAAGLQEKVASMRKIYQTELDYIAGKLQAVAPDFALSDVDKTVIETMINYDASVVTGKLQGVVDDIKSVVARGIISGQWPDVDSLVDDRTESLSSTLQTELDTMRAGFSRTVTVTKAQELGLESFEYMGPDDVITRPFCQHLLEDRDPPIYTIDEIEAMDNGQGLPVLQYGGGYNCRHDWRPVAEDE